MAVNFVQCGRCGNGVPVSSPVCTACGMPRGMPGPTPLPMGAPQPMHGMQGMQGMAGMQPMQPMMQPMMMQPMAMVPMGGMAMAPFACRGCGVCAPPILVNRISVGGWITFSVLILVFFPLCWIGLLIKESRVKCSRCGIVT